MLNRNKTGKKLIITAFVMISQLCSTKVLYVAPYSVMSAFQKILRFFQPETSYYHFNSSCLQRYRSITEKYCKTIYSILIFESLSNVFHEEIACFLKIIS